MLTLQLPNTPEGKAAAQSLMDTLDAAQVDYDAWEEDDGSISFDFSDSDRCSVLDAVKAMGLDIEQDDEDDLQAGEDGYRAEAMIRKIAAGSEIARILLAAVGASKKLN